eukprot:TRINITY_DN6011_c0_g1_i1.p2 TRINITY_DN6011_c0_g1~~TRINITY_DN6011_c0_g1_i1.p2  ORF type:complete len:134 (+),score=28.36 TRINITY_DN6011_c0_g1_i1:686-1087(+)
MPEDIENRKKFRQNQADVAQRERLQKQQQQQRQQQQTMSRPTDKQADQFTLRPTAAITQEGKVSFRKPAPSRQIVSFNKNLNKNTNNTTPVPDRASLPSLREARNMSFIDPGSLPPEFWKYGVVHYHIHSSAS